MFCDKKRELNFCNGYLSLLYFWEGGLSPFFVCKMKSVRGIQVDLIFFKFSIITLGTWTLVSATPGVQYFERALQLFRTGIFALFWSSSCTKPITRTICLFFWFTKIETTHFGKLKKKVLYCWYLQGYKLQSFFLI